MMSCKHFLPVLCLFFSLLAAGCASSVQPPAPPESEAAYLGKIVQLDNDALLLAATDGQSEALASVSLHDLSLADSHGATLAAADLACGMTVSVGFDGTLQETYPLQLSGASSLTVLSQEDDLVSFYLTVFDDLYARDPGLNDGVTRLAFDLDAVSNLTPAEKAALIWLAGSHFQMDTYAATYQDLLADGTLTDAEPYFTDGLLITLSAAALENGRFTFEVQKWRSTLGAYYFTNCTAQKSDGTWHYTIGAEAIS